MRNRVRKRILLSGLVCVLGLLACACGGTEEGPGAGESDGEAVFVEEPGDEDSVPETPEEPAESEDGGEAPSSGQWTDGEYDLEGNIKDLKDGQFTLVEVVTEELEDGTLMIGSSGEDDSEFEKTSIAYDEDTRFAIQTIYDGGDRSEMSEATAADLESGQLVKIWGSASDDGWKATQICIVKVE